MEENNMINTEFRISKACEKLQKHFEKLKITGMEFYVAMKKNEMLSFTGKWMELENIILSEVSLVQKTKNRIFSLICGH
jgi:hypothetical protein